MNRRFGMTWALVGLLVCLFVLSVNAPRSWEKSVRYRASNQEDLRLPHWSRGLALSESPLPRKEQSAPILVSGSPLVANSVSGLDDGQGPIEAMHADDVMRLGTEQTSAPAEADAAVKSSETVASDQSVAETAQETPEIAVVEIPETVWPKPRALLDRLERLAWECETGDWAREVARQVRRLGPAVAAASDEAPMIIERLNELAREANPIAAELERQGSPLLVELRRTQHAMGRRLDIWRRVFLAGGPGGSVTLPIDAPRLAACVARIEAILSGSEAGKPWREYLQLDRLEQLAARPAAYNEDSVRRVTREVLKHLDPAGLTSQQQRFLRQKPLAELAATLGNWLNGSVDLAAVLKHVEHVERDGLTSDARLLADDCERLAHSPLVAHQSLGRRIQLHYRNANVRVAVTEELLNRMIPEREPQYQYVSDHVLGRPVHGQSVTSTDVTVKLIPDPNRLRTALEINGLVSALTSSTVGPATFYSDSQSTYVASKEIELTTQGLKPLPAEVEVFNDIYLRSLKTTLDPIPLVGSLVKEVARSQHEQSRPAMSREVEQKVATRAKQQIDSEADARLGRLSQRLQERFVEPFAAMGLGPTMVSAETSDVRMTMRLRFGGDEQLGGWTPRPQAPADSLLSVQLHESTINNIIEQLGLDGGTFTVAELRRRIAQRFNRPEILEEESSNDDVVIRFADKDAARVQCQDGCVVISLSIELLSREPHRWKNFQVRAFYRPEWKGQTVELVREGVVRLTGERLNTGAQIALRGIFSKTFSRERPWVLTPPAMFANPQMAQVGVTQCVIEDGWVGLALGPTQAGVPPLVARRPVKQADAP